MRRIIFSVCVIVVLFYLISPSVFSATEEETLEYADEHLQSRSIQTMQEEPDSLGDKICRYISDSPINISFIELVCPGKQTHDIFSPYVKTGHDEEDSLAQLQQEYESLSQLDAALDDIAGTSSAQVLADQDNFLTRLLSLNGLFVDKETATTTRHVWTQSKTDDLGTDARKAISEKLVPAVLPYALRDRQLAQNSTPTPTSVPGKPPGHAAPIPPTATIQPSGTPGPTSAQSVGDATLFSGSGYLMFYQRDPGIALTRLPDCTSDEARACGLSYCTIIGAACGPLTLTNALLNSGITRLDNGARVDPINVINRHYPTMNSCGSSMYQGSTALQGYGFTTRTIVDQRADGYLDMVTAIERMRPYLNSGNHVWANIQYNGFGHHMLVVGVTTSSFLVLDPYYGYEREIPFSMATNLGIEFKNAFAFKRM